MDRLWAICLLFLFLWLEQTSFYDPISAIPSSCTKIRRNSSSELITFVFSSGRCRRHINGMKVSVKLPLKQRGKVSPRDGRVWRCEYRHHVWWISKKVSHWGLALSTVNIWHQNTILKCKNMSYMVGSTIWSLLRMHLLGQRIYAKTTLSVALRMQFNPPMLMHTYTARESCRVPCPTTDLPVILHPHKLP